MPLDSSLRPPISPIQPGAYSAVDASALQGQGAPVGPLLAILGAATGGQPNVLQLFRDPQALKNRLRSGAAYDCARFAMGLGLAPVAVMRVGSGILQSSLTLAGSGGAAITVTSLDYGAWTTGIKITVAATNNVTLTYVDANGVTYTENWNLGASATKQDIIDAINGKKVGYNASQYVTAASAGVGVTPLSVIAITPLASGSDGSALAGGDWTTGLSALEGETVDVIVAATGDATVHAQIEAHCDLMSTSAARKERVGVHGGVLAETTSQAISRMATLGKRSQLVYPGMQDYSNAGVLTTWDPFYKAAKVAAMHCLLADPAESLIHRLVPYVDEELVSGKYLSTAQGGDVDQLLRGNVTCTTPAPGGGFWIVDSLSGWKTDDSFRDFHKTRTADLTSQRLRNGLETQFVGRKALDATAGNIKEVATQIVQNLKDETILRAFGEVTVTQGSDAKTYNVTVPVLLPDATKYIFITVALQPSAPLNREAPVADTALL